MNTATAVVEAGEDFEVTLYVNDADLRAELEQYPAGRARHDYALSALKIGVTALRQAQGRVDADRLHSEGDRVVASLREQLASHQTRIGEELKTLLGHYFDPQSGRLEERLGRLVRADGELDVLVRRLVGGEGSALAQTLASHVGADSPLMKILDPNGADGLARSMTSSIEQQLNEQRERILSEFSLDNKQGALARFVDELAARHGAAGEALQESVTRMVSEFSLDREDSALSRLVNRVERAQRQITAEFSLDEEDSALARLRREMLESVEKQRKSNDAFQRDVLERLAEMKARREESQRSVRHGDDFEAAAFETISQQAQQAGDISSRVGATTGLVKHCKKGDIVISINPESVAGGERIVVEAKEDRSYTLQAALVEMETARKNRGAGVGLFVFSARTAPGDLEPCVRYGSDIVVVWDADDPRSDVNLTAGVSIAKALSVRAKVERDAGVADLQAIDAAILEIERQANGLGDISKSAESIKSHSDKILSRARVVREGLERELDKLRGQVEDLRLSFGAGVTG